jgi:hypothetical protein
MSSSWSKREPFVAAQEKNEHQLVHQSTYGRLSDFLFRRGTLLELTLMEISMRIPRLSA